MKIFSPNRPRQVLSGMYTSLLTSLLPDPWLMGPLFQHADDEIMMLVENDGLPDRVLEREQRFRDVGAEHDDVAQFIVVAGFVDFVAIDQKSARDQVDLVDFLKRRRRRHHPAIVHAMQVANLLREDAHRHAVDDGVQEQELIVVAIGEPIRRHEAAAAVRRIVLRLDAFDDDVGGALAFDVFEHVLHAAFAERHQRDDGAGADDDAQDRQERA